MCHFLRDVKIPSYLRKVMDLTDRIVRIEDIIRTEEISIDEYLNNLTDYIIDNFSEEKEIQSAVSQLDTFYICRPRIRENIVAVGSSLSLKKEIFFDTILRFCCPHFKRNLYDEGFDTTRDRDKFKFEEMLRNKPKHICYFLDVFSVPKEWMDLNNDTTHGIRMCQRYYLDKPVEYQNFIRKGYSYNRARDEHNIQYKIKIDDIDEIRKLINESNKDRKYSPHEITKMDIFKKETCDRWFLDSKSTKELTAISLAAYHGSIECFKYFYNRLKCEISDQTYWCAVFGCNKEIFEILFEREPSKFENCIQAALFAQNNWAIDKLIENNPSFMNSVYVYDAAQYNNIRAVLCAFEHHNIRKSDEEKNDDHHPLIIACQRNYVAMADLLLEHTDDIDKDTRDKRSEPPIFKAIFNQNTVIFKMLKDKGCNVEYTDEKGQNLLHIAAMHNSTDILELLLQDSSVKGLIEEKSKHYLTPLAMAVGKRYLEAVKVLLNYDADPNCKTNSDTTPLHKAAENDDIEMIKLLFDHGAIPTEDHKKLFPSDRCRDQQVRDLLKSREREVFN